MAMGRFKGCVEGPFLTKIHSPALGHTEAT